MLVRQLFAATTASLLLAAAPAPAQVSVGVHIDIPIFGGGRGPVVHRPAPPPVRYVAVYDYSRKRFGDWRKDARKWVAVTLWWADGRYYEREIPRARRVVVYRYHDTYFREPDERGWSDYRERYFYRDADRFYRDDGRWSDDRDRRDDRWDDRRDDRRGNDRWDDRRDDRRPEPPRPAPRADDRRARPRP